MYFEDLTTYQYLTSSTDHNMLNVGWLDKKYSFHKGKLSENFLDRLFELCLSPVNKTLGYHQCPFCVGNLWGMQVMRNNQKITLGSAEIRVNGINGIIYAAPDLIYHYAKEHSYIPPEEFIRSVLFTKS